VYCSPPLALCRLDARTADLPQIFGRATAIGGYSPAAPASVLAKRGFAMTNTIKGVAMILLAVAAVKLYPDFVRYMKIRAM
jgi:hypothetical protein